MVDERCRITVVGDRARADLAVPVRAPIAEYVLTLAELCAPPQQDAMPAVWSLAPVLGPAFDPGSCLEAAGVVDGMTLYLRDILADEFTGPVVVDIEERVAEVDDGKVWNARSRAYTTTAAGLFVMIVAAVALVMGADGAAAIPAFFAAGFATATIAWAVGRKNWPVPSGLRLALAVATCPLFVGAVSGLPWPSVTGGLVAASVIASLGAFVAYLAFPTLTTVVLQAVCGSAMLLVVPLVMVRANAVEAAAVISVVLLVTLSALPRLSGQVAALPSGKTEIDDTEATVRRVQSLLVGLNTSSCVLIAICLLRLGTSDDWFALGLVLCLGLALLCRAGSSRLPAIVAAMLVTGAFGLTVVALRLPGRLLGADVHAWAGPLAVLVAGVIVTWFGLVMCFRSALHQVDLDERWKWPPGAAAFLSALSVPLAAGVFGVFSTLMRAGGKL